MSETLAPFITGSVAYGEPRPDSDIDLVVWATGTTKQALVADGFPIRFGKLNIILVDDLAQWQIWKDGTEHLIGLRNSRGSPVTRDEAVEYLISRGVTQSEDVRYSRQVAVDAGEVG